MATNNSIVDQSNYVDRPTIPASQKLSGAEFNVLKNFQNAPAQQLTGSLDDTDIIIDGTKQYDTTIVETGATRTITANASGHLKGNKILQRYQFDVNCTITLTAFDTNGNTTGTIAPIPAGTYDFIFESNINGINLNIPLNSGEGISEAPIDTYPYSRKDAGWTKILPDETPFIEYYVSATGNDGTAVAGDSKLPYALVSAASLAAYNDKVANNNNNRVYVLAGGSIKDFEINRSGIPIYAEDGAVVWTDAVAKSVISDRLLGEGAVLDIQGKGTFVHTNPSFASNQGGVNLKGDGVSGKVQAKLIDSVRVWGEYRPSLTIDDCEIMVGNSPAQRFNSDIILNRCLIRYGLIGSATNNVNCNTIINDCIIISENAYDRVITDRGGNTVTTVILSDLISDRLIDSHSIRCPITGTSGGGNVTIASVIYASAFNTDLETTADDFVTTHAAALLAVVDQIVAKRWKEVTLTGTTGTSTITLAGTPYLATFNTDLATTATDFITSHGSAINTQGYRVVQFGDILAFSKTAEAVFTLTAVNTSGDLNGTISYQFHLGSVYDNDFVVSFANTSGDLNVTFNDHFTEEELQNRVAASGLENEYGYCGFYLNHSSSSPNGYSNNWTILNSILLLRKNKSIGIKILYRINEFDGERGGFIARNIRVKRDNAGITETTAFVYGKDDLLARPAEIDLFSFEHDCQIAPIEIVSQGYSTPVIRSNDPSINNVDAVDDTTKLSKTLTPDQTVASAVEFKSQAHANTGANAIKSFSATPTFNFDADGNDQEMPITGNVTTFSTSNEAGSSQCNVWLVNDATAGRTVAAPTGWTKATDSSDHSTVANKVNYYQFFTNPNLDKKYYSIIVL